MPDRDDDKNKPADDVTLVAGEDLTLLKPAQSKVVPSEEIEESEDAAAAPVERDQEGGRPPAGDRYSDRGEIGKGGMGTVYRTFDNLLLREIAMKTIEYSQADEESAALFVEEAQITGQLDHPNIVPVYDFGRRGDRQAFFTMKLVRGRTLSEVIGDLHQEGFAGDKLEEILRIVLKVCEAVSFAHSRGIVHRDLKPANIMIGSHGQVYVMDWGLGMLLEGKRRVAAGGAGEVRDAIQTSSPGTTSRSSLAGTVAYMAPEQAAGRLEEIDARTDVFALGAILYKVLTDKAPYHSPNLMIALGEARSGKAAPPQEVVGAGRPLPPGLCEIAARAMQPEPDDRYQTVDELHEEIERFLRGGGWFATRRFQPGEAIVVEGDQADAAYVVVEGRCEVYQDRPEGRRSLRILGPGDVFGETAILSSQTRTATVAAEDQVTVKVVTADAFERELGRSSWVAALVKQLASRFLELEQRLKGD